jgi:hypothetical protein
MKRIAVTRIGVVAAVVASAWYFARNRGAAGVFQFDDAFMFLRYAKHFIAGHGFSWNVKALEAPVPPHRR